MLQGYLEAAVETRSEHVAVVGGSGSLTYGELERRSNQVAWLLRDLGVARGARVGLYLDKSVESIVAVYGTLKAGAVYVPLDPLAPVTRLGYIARDCDIECLLTGVAKARRWSGLLDAGAPIKTFVVMDDDTPGRPELASPPGSRVLGSQALDAQQETRPPSRSISLDLAYLLYTSGSTGQPKGVMLSHRNGLTFVDWAVEEFGVRAEDRVSSHAPLHFDLSIFDVFAAARAGAKLVLVPRELSAFPLELVRFIAGQAITVWYSVPSVLSMIVQRGGLTAGDLPHLRTVLFAGEVFPTKYLRRLTELLPGARLCNLFGPTETNVCTWYDVETLPEDEAETIPIGKAIADVEVFAAGPDGPSAPGEVGELCVRGSTVMQGYWGDEERTVASLVPHPFRRDVPDLVYRTGDLVREDGEGNYRFLGRRDAQIKSRGYRIELGDIEAALNANPSVDECAVIAVPDELVTNRLAAAVSVRNGLTAGDLARFCAERLPAYMIPELFDLRDTLPKTSTGKLDRTALATELTAHLTGAGAPSA